MFGRTLLLTACAAGLAFGQGRGFGDTGGSDTIGSTGAGSGGRSRGGGGGMGEDMGAGMPRLPQRQSKVDLFYDKLKLNKDQKEQAARILAETAGKARPMVEQYNKARQQMAMAILGKKNEDEIKPLIASYTAVCAQITGLEAEAFGKIYAELKSNQQKNAPQAFEILAGVFLPTAGAGRGMGRMNRGGRN